MKFIGRMLRNELLSLSTLFFILIPGLNHIMAHHGGPDLSHFSVSALTDGNFSNAFSGIASQASSAGFSMVQAGGGSSDLFISHGPIFLN